MAHISIALSKQAHPPFHFFLSSSLLHLLSCRCIPGDSLNEGDRENNSRVARTSDPCSVREENHENKHRSDYHDGACAGRLWTGPVEDTPGGGSAASHRCEAHHPADRRAGR